MRYRTIANRVLAAVLLCFVMAVVARYVYGTTFWTNLFFHVLQAALVGGLADWFAVTALFEKPLGIPWHTALIPRNRERMIDAIATTVEKDLLSVSLIKKRLENFRVTSYLIKWLDSDEGKQQFSTLFSRLTTYVISRLDKAQLADYIVSVCKEQAIRSNSTQQIKDFGRWALSKHKEDQVINFILDELIKEVAKESTGKAFYDYLNAQQQQAVRHPGVQLAIWLGEYTDSLNLEDLVKALQQDAAALLLRMKASDHPGRRWVRRRLFIYIRNLESDATVASSLQEWKEQLVNRLPINDLITQLLEVALDPKHLMGGKGIYHSPLLVWGLSQAQTYWNVFKQNQNMQDWVDDHARQALLKIIETEYSFVGKVVRDALSTFSDVDLSRFVEEKVGDDLAWIRINGSVVGAVVGLFLFLFLHFLYDPYAVPLIRAWLQ